MRKQFRFAALALAAAALAAGCATYQEERDTTQPGKLSKAVFADGPWYTLRTVIDSPYEASFTFVGEAGQMEKIQWDIQEDHLYAYRTYEFVQGEDGPRKEADGNRFRGEPIAAYKILSHFDLWHQYNAVTGEEIPVLYEAQERPWYEREYMRVDWSANHIMAFGWMGSEICGIQGLITTDPVGYAPTRPDDPQQVYFATRNGQEWKNHYDLETTQELGRIDYIDVVNQEFAHVNIAALFGSLTYADAQGCLGYPTMPLGGDMRITYRQSFMKMDPERFAQAERVYYPDPSFEKFGYFRDERYTYNPDRGATDFLGYQMHRWNIWQQTTVMGADGKPQPIPYAQREIKPIVYYINDAAPQEYRDIARDVIAGESWNRSFAGALQAVGHPSMNGKDPMTTPAADLPQVFVLKETDKRCGTTGQQECQQLGDLRYSFMYYVDRPSLGSPLGYGPSFNDPETGELIMAVANFYGAALDSMAGYIGDLYDLTKGNFDELDIMTGENVRQFFQNTGGDVLPPTFPQINIELLDEMRDAAEAAKASGKVDLAKLPPELLEMKQRLDLMRRDPAARTSPYTLRSLAGTQFEQMLVEEDSNGLLMGLPVMNAQQRQSPELLEKISPLRNGGLINQYDRMLDFWSTGGGKVDRGGAAKQGCVIKAEFFMDASLVKLIADAEAAIGAGATKDDVVDYILLHTFRGVEEHEVGHTLGLRHNFEGTYDEENYHDQYWDIVAANPEQPQSAFDANGDNVSNYEEWQAWYAARLETKRAREAAGIDFYTYSSIMDYSSHFYYNDVKGIGKYDHAAIKYGYANTVEVYANPNDKGPHRENRTDVPYFLGGERCGTTDDCPDGNAFSVNGLQYRQHCRIAQAHDGSQASIGTGVAVDDAATAATFGNRSGVCSNVYTELRLGEYDNWTTASTPVPVAQPAHRFCSDDRVDDRPFCTRYDEGKTAVEVVQNQIEEYQRSYIFNNFRRYRLNFEPYFYFSRIWGRYYQPIGKIYQSMLYQLYYTPGFYQDPEKGFVDFLQASILALNFFGQVMATPDVGYFKDWKDAANGEVPLLEPSYYGELYDQETSQGDGRLAFVPLGLGKHLWTELETGYYGAIYRYARMGTFWDKLLAIEALATRDWGFPQANDETYPINFYDAFKPELLEMYGGMASDDAFAYGPAAKIDRAGYVSEVKYRNYWTGQFFDSDLADWGLKFTGPTGSVGFPDAGDPSMKVMDPGGSFILRLYSIIYSLAYFPVFYDNTFPGYVQLSTFGTTDPRYVEGLQDSVTHYSPKYRKLYSATPTEDGKSFTVTMVSRAKYFNDLLTYYRDPATNADSLVNHPRCERSDTAEQCREDLINWTENELENVETTLNFTSDILRQMGVVF